MNAREFINSGKKLTAGQRWLFDNGHLKYLAEILPDTSLFKILIMINSDSEYPNIVLNAVVPHKSLLTGGYSWNYLEGQEAPK